MSLIELFLLIAVKWYSEWKINHSGFSQEHIRSAIKWSTFILIHQILSQHPNKFRLTSLIRLPYSIAEVSHKYCYVFSQRVIEKLSCILTKGDRNTAMYSHKGWSKYCHVFSQRVIEILPCILTNGDRNTAMYSHKEWSKYCHVFAQRLIEILPCTFHGIYTSQNFYPNTFYT